MIRYFWLFVFLCVVISTGNAQRVATLEVEPLTQAEGLVVPASIDLDAITFIPDSALALVEVQGDRTMPVPFQIEQGDHRTLHWLVQSTAEENKAHVFELVKGTPHQFDQIEATAAEGTLTIHSGTKNLLRYCYETVYPPAGVDSAYKRSGYIHPLWSPHGQVLTRIQPPDHYHHYGIWNPWTHVLFEADTVDFWNLGKREGTVRFADFVSVTDGSVFSEFQALHQHVVFKKQGSEKVALDELQTVRVYRPQDDQGYYLIDFISQMNCAGQSPVLLLEYRYGGFGWRTTEQWNKDNSQVLTSEGKTRKDADGSTARWCIVQGELDDDYAGVVMMSYPTNYNHPEPLRIWPENMNKRGDMFANFSPTKNKNWLLKPRQNYVLKYRLLVFNGHFTKEKAESAWTYFAVPPKVNVKIN
jgi:hypothetical protein